MSIRITDSVTWVGKKDWELRDFHGMEYSTHRLRASTSIGLSFHRLVGSLRRSLNRFS